MKTHKGHNIEAIETKYVKNLEYLRKNISSNIDPHDFNVIFGPFEKLNIITNSKDIKLTKIKTYETPHPFIHRIVSTSDNSVWINCYTINTLQEVQKAQELTTVRDYNDKTLFDIKVLKTGNLLLTQAEDSHLYSLSKTGQMHIVHD